jgi:hypothetical protein
MLALVPAVGQARVGQARLARTQAVGSQTTAGTPNSGQGAVGDTTPVVSATVEQCVTGADLSARSATFAGQMVAITGTQRMTMRIDVLQRTPGTLAFHPVSAQGLGVWRSSAPGVKIYQYLKQVTNLPAPAVFRALVRFRWLNAKGRVIRHDMRRTAACEQPDLSPAPTTTTPTTTPAVTPSPTG